MYQTEDPLLFSNKLPNVTGTYIFLTVVGSDPNPYGVKKGHVELSRPRCTIPRDGTSGKDFE